MRPRTLVLLCLVVAAVASLISVPLAYASRHGSGATPFGTAHTADQAAPPPPTLLIPDNPASVKLDNGVYSYYSWTLIDRKNGQSAGSANQDSGLSTTESMIKAWIAADYLRQHDQVSDSVLNDLNNMIIHSDDNIAQRYYVKNGSDDSLTDLISRCGLKDTLPQPELLDGSPYPGHWSYTQMSSADAARMGLCIANGTAAGPKWTDWLLKSMRSVEGSVDDQQRTTGGGRWGILDGLPANLVAGTAIKNGWTPQISDHNWHVNCLAINDDWVLAIELKYRWTSPTGNWQGANNLRTGAEGCASITRQLVGVPVA